VEERFRAGARRVAVVATVHADDSVLVAAMRQGDTVYATVNARHELRARHHLWAHVEAGIADVLLCSLDCAGERVLPARRC